MKQLFIAWTSYRWRKPDLSTSLFIDETHIIAPRFGSRWLRPIEYTVKLCATLRLLHREKPDALWIQAAPAPLLYTAHIYKALFRRNVTIIAVCRSGIIRKPWVRLSGTARLLNGCDKVLVHSYKAMLNAMRLGVPEKRIEMVQYKGVEVGDASR